jgi:UPF0271 protein
MWYFNGRVLLANQTLKYGLRFAIQWVRQANDFRRGRANGEERIMKKKAVDLNCDMGESFGPYKLGLDEEVIKFISSANVGCGFHGGDPHVMRETVAMAKEYGVGVGAHPGLPDLLGFGRREMKVTPEEVRDYFIYQIGALKAFVEVAGLKLQHVKAHGALDAMARRDEDLTKAMCEAAIEISPDLIWLAHSGKGEIAGRMGLKVVQEVYADRAYNADKTLVSRTLPRAVIKDPQEIGARINQLLETGTITTIDGKALELDFNSICVHGDTPGAVGMIRTIREILAANDIAVIPMAELI